MVEPDDACDGLRAILSQIRETMEATKQAFTAINDVAVVKGEGGDISLERLLELVGELASTLTLCVLKLDNRFERIERRPGLPDSTVEGLFSEFFRQGD